MEELEKAYEYLSLSAQDMPEDVIDIISELEEKTDGSYERQFSMVYEGLELILSEVK